MSSDFLMGMGLRIRKRRIELGMTQDELCKKSGFASRSSIAKVELGDRDLPHDKIVSIAKALDVSPAYIMGWKEEYVQLPVISEDEIMQYARKLAQLSNDQRKAIFTLIDTMEGK